MLWCQSRLTVYLKLLMGSSQMRKSKREARVCAYMRGTIVNKSVCEISSGMAPKWRERSTIWADSWCSKSNFSTPPWKVADGAAITNFGLRNEALAHQCFVVVELLLRDLDLGLGRVGLLITTKR